jgi:hypothetical protein
MKAMSDSDALRKHLLELLEGRSAHADFDSAVSGFPVARAGDKPPGAPYSAWQLLEHMRIAQWDILEFSRNPKYVSPKWPEGYWPKTESPPEKAAWGKSVREFRADLKAMMKLVADPKSDLFARIPHGQGQTLLREALLVADHNSYHLGQFVLLRRLLGAWKG